MPVYDQLDAFKAAALVASGRIGRGAGFRNRRMFGMCLDRTLGALSELEYLLSIARTLDLIADDVYLDLESRRGRASF